MANQRLHRSTTKEVSPYAVSGLLYGCKTPNSYDSSLNLSDYRGSLQDNDTFYEGRVCDSKIDNTGTKYATTIVFCISVAAEKPTTLFTDIVAKRALNQELSI